VDDTANGVRPGDEAPVVEHQLTRTDLVMYAGASGDFNPMHHDEVKAHAAGLPSVFGHGMYTMGLLARALTDYVGVGNLERYQVRFTKQTWPGETLATRVVVLRTYEEDGRQKAELECSVANEHGEPKVQGTAVAVLPGA
jgi:acyl dehydratase